jgi:protein TonB
LRFPPDAKDKEISGQVLISFKVSSDGTISSVKVKEKLFPSCDAEAVRLVENGPKWEPALRRGSPTSSRQTVTVLFK